MDEQQTKKRGRKKGYRWTDEMKAKSRATRKARRECAAMVSKPQDCCVSCSDDEDRDDDNSGNR